MPVIPSHRWTRTAVAGLALLVAGAAVAACSSGGSSATPQGLSGSQTGGNSQSSVEDREAAAVLEPQAGSFLAGKTTVTLLGPTTPTNGDENPYAIWPVTETVGSVASGDVLVDNFNNKSNNQGTGTTIVDVHPNGKVSVFATIPNTVSGCPGGVGLTTAMVQLETGWVIVGSLPSTNGKTASGAGCLLVLSPTGQVASTITGSYLNGPWDETVQDNGSTATLFVTNTLNGITPTSSDSTQVDLGDVVRLSLSESTTTPPSVTAETQVASGFPEKPDASAFIKGPTGVVLGSSGTLYVANNLANEIDAIPNALTATSSAGTGTVLSRGGQLANPLGLALAPNGNILAANAINGKIVEVTPTGSQVGEYYADHNVGQDPPGNGDLFDVAVNQAGTGILFVNDGTNTLELLH
jgi:sugar lactone lactonase YvrE